MILLIKIILFGSLFTFSSNATEIYTAKLSPWTISQKEGVFVEIVSEIEKRLNRRAHIQYLPWSRAQAYAKKSKDNVIIFPLTRIPDREESYTWIVKVMPLELVFVSYKKDPPKTLDEARKLNKVMAHNDSPPYYFLKNNKLKNLLPHHRGVGSIPKLLQSKRIDAWFSSKILSLYYFKDLEIKNKIKYGPPIKSGWLYIAGSKNIDKKTVQEYRKVFKELEQEGFIKKVIAKYKY